MDISNVDSTGVSFKQATLKRIFDFCLSFVGLGLTWWLILLAWLVASFDTRSNGLFIQARVGRNGVLFKVLKIKTMREIGENNTTVTQRGDPRITHLGSFFRKTKIDELPQLWNILCGEMSFVGPRPDVPGFADNLKGAERALLTIRPGLTGPATLAYRNEEELLAQQSDPEAYNREVIWPNKVLLNLEYIRHWSIMGDIRYILQTVFH